MTSEYEHTEHEKAAGRVVEEAEQDPENDPGAAYLRGHAVYAIASICHEANRAYAWTLGQERPAWARASKEERTSAVMGVSAIIEERVTRPRDSHDHWLRTKSAMGWRYGPEKDPIEKTHPDIVAWDDLPEDEQRKDMLFFGIVVALLADPAQFGEVHH